jgi:hypothetical protein
MCPPPEIMPGWHGFVSAFSGGRETEYWQDKKEMKCYFLVWKEFDTLLSFKHNKASKNCKLITG